MLVSFPGPHTRSGNETPAFGIYVIRQKPEAVEDSAGIKILREEGQRLIRAEDMWDVHSKHVDGSLL